MPLSPDFGVGEARGGKRSSSIPGTNGTLRLDGDRLVCQSRNLSYSKRLDTPEYKLRSLVAVIELPEE
jgi:hypothetical protein